MKTRLGVLLITISIFLIALPTAAAEPLFQEEWQKLGEEASREAEEGNVIAMFKKGVSLAMIGKFEAAVEWFDRVSEHPHRKSEGEAYQKEIEESLKKSPEEHILLGQKAFLHFTHKEYQEALTILDKMEEQDPANIWLDNYRALILVEQDKYSSAREILRCSLEKEENRYTRAFMGYAYWQEGQYARASKHFLRTGTLIFSINKLLP